MSTALDRASPWIAATVPAWAIVVLATQLIGTPTRSIAAVQAMTPWMLALLLATVLAISRAGARFDFAGGASAGPAVVYLVVLTPVAFASGGTEPAAGATVRVVAANVLYSDDRLDDLAVAIADLDADVVAITEATPDALARSEAVGAAARLPHRHERPAEGVEGLAIWSRYPFAQVAGALPGSDHRAVVADVALAAP